MPEDRRVLTRSSADPTVVWDYGAGRDQTADVYLPDPIPGGAGTALPAPPAVLLVHGGFWREAYDRTHLRPAAAALAAAGYPTILVEYARIPGDPDAGLADLRAVIDALPGPVDAAADLLVVGHSAGGHLALLLAASSGVAVRGCLALAPVADLELAERLQLDGDAVVAYLGGLAADRPDLDPRRRVPLVPVTVLHGVGDTIVPLAVSESYCLAQPALLTRADCAHFEPIDPLSSTWPTVIAELSALVPRSGIE